MNGVWWNVDHVTGFPLITLDFVLGLPVVSVCNFHVAILVQVVATAFEHIHALFSQVAVLARLAAGRNDLHVGIDRFDARVHGLIQQVLEQTLARHFPWHVIWAHYFVALGIACRHLLCIVQKTLVILALLVALQP